MEKALGPDHPSVATTLDNVATLYSARRKIRRGRAARQAIVGHQGKAVWPQSSRRGPKPEQLGGDVLSPRPLRPGRAALHSRAGDQREVAWPQSSHPGPEPEHSSLAYTMQNSVSPRPSRSTFGALALREKSVGPNHPEVGVSLHNLAMLYYCRGHFAV